MKAILFIGLGLGFLYHCAGAQVVAEFDWEKLAQRGQLIDGAPVKLDGRAALRISNTNETPLQAHLLKIEKPPVSGATYAIVGEIKYEAVKGDGYLEMWNYYPGPKPGLPERAYFSRTLGESGEMGKLAGTSGWRRFTLPFDRTGSSAGPARLEINLFLPTQGTVHLGPVRLVEYHGSLVGAKPVGAWWSDQTGGLLGGIGGSILGCLGGSLGWLASKGRARGFVLRTTKLFIVLGTGLAVGGIVALWRQQPFGVWSVLLFAALILIGISPPVLRRYQKTYEDQELRKMAAADAMRG